MSVADAKETPPQPKGFLGKVKSLFTPATKGRASGAPNEEPTKRTPKPLLLLLLALVLGIGLMFFLRKRSPQKRQNSDSNEAPVGHGVKQIRYWKHRGDWESPLTMTLIETNDGLRMLDEADPNGNGVITLYLPKSQKGGKRCFSLVRERAIMYNRLTYEALKTDCVTSYRIIKRDFKQEMPVTVTLRGLAKGGFEGVIEYLKENQVLSGSNWE